MTGSTCRARPQRQHRLDKGIRGWIVTTARKNYWRVASWYDLEDLIQDGYVCYARCNQRYGHVRDQAHFMALVKTTYIHHITDLANERSRAVASVGMDPEVLNAVAPPTMPDGEFVALFHSLPKELKQLVSVLLDDAKSIPYLKQATGNRETNNEYLCRLIGLDPLQVNLEAMFRAHFSSV